MGVAGRAGAVAVRATCGLLGGLTPVEGVERAAGDRVDADDLGE
ncbi:hypothetical protein [Streptomyces sp. NBRC 110028]|nr:hypothetical protein [Streptomyces sp. NBRC 110028]